MRTYFIWYKPIWGTFTRMCEHVKASSAQQAEVKFYLSKAGDNCQEIILIE